MSNEIIDLEETVEKNIEEIDYKALKHKYNNKLIKKLSIVFVSITLIFMTTLFDKYAAFDIVLSSQMFKILLSISVIFAIGISIYIYNTRNNETNEKIITNLKVLLNVFDLVTVIPIFMAVVSLSNAFIISPATVIGQSMEPTFYEGEDILMLHFTNNYERFDVVVLETDQGEFYLKRIIGLPGDHIRIDYDVITINGEIIDQIFLEDENGSINVYTYCDSSRLEVCDFDVPMNSYFVMGDNREHSLDSRYSSLGYVSEDQLYGIVVIKFDNIFRNILE